MLLSKYQGNVVEIFKKLYNSHKQIEDIIISMLQYPLIPSNYLLYNNKIQNIYRIVDSNSKNRSSQEWRKYLDYQLSKVL